MPQARGVARASATCLLAVSLVLTTGVARAQLPVASPAQPAAPPAEPSAADCPEQDATICGRRHFEAGTRAFEAADYQLAEDEFRLAMAQRPHAVIRFNLALSLARLRRPTAAIEQLRLVETDEAADRELRGRAESERKSAEQALARVTLRLSDPSRERIELDGAEVKLAPGAELLVDPGPHQLRVISGGSIVLEQELDLTAGERVELRVGERSRRIDVVVVPPLAPAPSAAPKESPPPKRGVSPAWFYAGAGATALLTGLTVWSALDTKRAFDDYEHDLPDLSHAEADERVSDGHARELRTNLLLAGSLVCAAGTAVLGIWVVDFGGGKQTGLLLSPQRVALSGNF